MFNGHPSRVCPIGDTAAAENRRFVVPPGMRRSACQLRRGALERQVESRLVCHISRITPDYEWSGVREFGREQGIGPMKEKSTIALV
ncbi:MAG: hypothetical protein AAFR55_07575, partial [Pseudomonadota bacterium]